MTIRITVCQNRICRRDGSPLVYEAFEAALKGQANIELMASGCLGQCGGGPNVCIDIPGEPLFWYSLRDALDCIPIIIAQHLGEGKPVWQLLSTAKHPHARAIYGPPKTSPWKKLLGIAG